jgi:DNA-binding CsgD family transcriptional regulator
MGPLWVEGVKGELGAIAELGLDHRAYLHEVDRVLRPRLGYAVAAWATADPATLLLTSCTVSGRPLDPERLEHLARIEYTTEEPGDLTDLYRSGRLACSLLAEVDDPMTVTRYREITHPLGSHDELRLVFVLDGLVWGMLIAHRGVDDGAFTAEDVDAAADLSATIAYGLRLAFLRAAANHPAGTDEPPGQLVVGADGSIVSSTDLAERWLEAIGGDEHLSFLLSTLAPKVQVDGQRSITVATDSGPVTVHATSARDAEGATALMLERPRPIVLTNLIIAAYGLTPREREVAEQVLRGATTKQIARALGISDYTVQDHLKAIFAKVGVSTRGDLSWALSTRFYLPPIRDGATPGPYGYYLDA